MPCYLFTWHAYGSWLPDRPRGYVHWKNGLQPQDERLASAYRRNMTLAKIVFDEPLQEFVIEECLAAVGLQKFRLHGIAFESTHIHVLVSWRDERSKDKVSDGLKQSLTRRITRERGRRKWLAKNGSKQPVKDRRHFDHLVGVYLPSHRGWKWDEERGRYR